ncbi:fimbrial biogenesis chaperone [Mucilaginibacter ginkgonis]|uniref:Uncharacterized protein n=1 Tax=Mucilaginibacter ginkgonis TaxID=2682091 RepID=A0A6I4I2V7_9SPHI|nr:molecular chaperone [Mucilaginibacter ginkgonis]QQL49134.1 hypothetical protein GO620_013240 [Mucilaginibacter ginkgonis]
MRYFYAVIFLALINLPLGVKAQGNLLIVPRRVVFEGAKRVQELNLANTGIDSARFTISIIEYRMEKDGSFKEITAPDSGQYFADKFVRFFPRSVSLAPNEAQTIKLQLVNTAQLQTGEYRSHIYFRAVPKIDNSPIIDKSKDSAAIKGEISIKLLAQYGLSIPLIIRVGQQDLKVSMTNLIVKYQDNKPVLQLDINRSGNVSVYGDIKVNYVADNGTVSSLGIIRGLAVYTPNAVRTVNIALEPKSNQNLHKGKLQVIYTAQPEAKPQKFAETELLLK